MTIIKGYTKGKTERPQELHREAGEACKPAPNISIYPEKQAQ